MQDEIWHQRSIQNYNGAVLSVSSVYVDTSLSSYLSLRGEVATLLVGDKTPPPHLK